MTNTFKNGIRASVTTVTTVYTAPGGTTATVIGLVVANAAGADTTATVKVIDNSATVTANLCLATPVPAASNLNVLNNNNRVVLEAGDSITVTCVAACDVVVSVMEIS
jgi:hypothetical protein